MLKSDEMEGVILCMEISDMPDWCKIMFYPEGLCDISLLFWVAKTFLPINIKRPDLLLFI